MHKRQPKFVLDLGRQQAVFSSNAVVPVASAAVKKSSHHDSFDDELSGYDASFRATVETRTSNQKEEMLKLKKSFDVALGPAKAIPMNAFMMYMSGNSIHIFSIMITAMMFFNPVKALLGTNAAFAKLSEESFSFKSLLPKLAYVFFNIVSIGLALYKCSNMGLLPTSSSDWLSFLSPKQALEVSTGGFVST